MRQGTDLGSVDQTEKRLRAIRAAGCAIKSGQVFDQIAVKKIQDRWKGFRLTEVFQLFGGGDAVEQICAACPANVIRREHEIAGCFGWLPRTVEGFDCAKALEAVCSPKLKSAVSSQLLDTEPLWYGLWADGSLSGQRLGLVLKVFQQVLEKAKPPNSLHEFVNVLIACQQHGLALDCEWVPPGHSDGLRWTVVSHCERCKAAANPNQQRCAVCKKSGKGHPEVRRKVLGLRPWINLDTVLGPEKASEFLTAHHLVD